jgi:BirA family transcriptional regulator, biotin operon repressor / biotin---[acetyl-CoA-carboxylase] ligase
MDTPYASVVLDSVESTQDEAAARFSGAPLLVVAAHQSRGRGRFDRVWLEPDRGLFASLAFLPDWSPEHRRLIPLASALAMRDALGEVLGVGVDLRWPNDLMIGGNKVGGILVEATDGRVIVGCGVNLWWAAPIEGAGSILDADPGPGPAGDVAAVWARKLLERLAADPAYWGHHEYESACTTVGQPVAFERGSGKAVGVAADGSLLVETGYGVVAVDAGEVRTGATLPTPPSGGGEASEESP